LNNLPLEKGFIFNNYSSGGTETQEFQRTYFSDENAKICDTIRKKIETWKESNKINQDEYFYLLACLIEATDKKANTASVYGAFLKHLKKTANEKISLKPLEIIESNLPNQAYNQDVNQFLKNIYSEILYLDPPYNTRVYGDNYHILETIAKYDNPEIKGKTGNRTEKVKSKYSSKTQVKEAFLELMTKANANYIFLSYNNEGLLSLDEIKEIMSTRGEYGFFEKEYQRFKADKTENRNHKAKKTTEYLHYVIVNK
jgi:adenine-specific DNA-methyltransferase